MSTARYPPFGRDGLRSSGARRRVSHTRSGTQKTRTAADSTPRSRWYARRCSSSCLRLCSSPKSGRMFWVWALPTSSRRPSLQSARTHSKNTGRCQAIASSSVPAMCRLRGMRYLRCSAKTPANASSSSEIPSRLLYPSVMRSWLACCTSARRTGVAAGRSPSTGRSRDPPLGRRDRRAARSLMRRSPPRATARPRPGTRARFPAAAHARRRARSADSPGSTAPGTAPHVSGTRPARAVVASSGTS